MADKKISALTAASTPLAGSEVLPIVQGGSTVKVSVANLTSGRATSALSQSVASFTPDSGAFIHTASSANAASRYWRTANDLAAWADWALQQSTDNTGAAYTTRFYFDGNGNAEVSTGNLVIGTAGKGIDFSANTGAAGMTSELLDWYEEGTWTPTAVSTGGAITAYTSAATYTRVGRLVYINGYVQITNPGTASGGLVIDAIPYINGNAGVSGQGQQMALVRESENTGQAYLGFMLSNSTQLRISALTGGAVSWNTNDQYSFSLCYYTS
jgi:hypothetical protein